MNGAQPMMPRRPLHACFSGDPTCSGARMCRACLKESILAIVPGILQELQVSDPEVADRAFAAYVSAWERFHAHQEQNPAVAPRVIYTDMTPVLLARQPPPPPQPDPNPYNRPIEAPPSGAPRMSFQRVHEPPSAPAPPPPQQPPIDPYMQPRRASAGYEPSQHAAAQHHAAPPPPQQHYAPPAPQPQPPPSHAAAQQPVQELQPPQPPQPMRAEDIAAAMAPVPSAPVNGQGR